MFPLRVSIVMLSAIEGVLWWQSQQETAFALRHPQPLCPTPHSTIDPQLLCRISLFNRVSLAKSRRDAQGSERVAREISRRHSGCGCGSTRFPSSAGGGVSVCAGGYASGAAQGISGSYFRFRKNA